MSERAGGRAQGRPLGGRLLCGLRTLAMGLGSMLRRWRMEEVPAETIGTAQRPAWQPMRAVHAPLPPASMLCLDPLPVRAHPPRTRKPTLATSCWCTRAGAPSALIAEDQGEIRGRRPSTGGGQGWALMCGVRFGQGLSGLVRGDQGLSGVVRGRSGPLSRLSESGGRCATGQWQT